MKHEYMFKDGPSDIIEELQSLVLKSWRDSCLRTSNFKLPHLESFNEKRDPHKYLTTLKTQTSTIRAIETLRCKQSSSYF
jgi:hypothetical protein